MDGFARARTWTAISAVALILLSGGCANDTRPADHGEFVEKWINSVSHIDGQDLNCKIAIEWATPDWYSTCQDVFNGVQEPYVQGQEYYYSNGKDGKVSQLKDVTFKCQVEGSKLEATRREYGEVPVSCVDESGLGVLLRVINPDGSPAKYVIAPQGPFPNPWD